MVDYLNAGPPLGVFPTSFQQLLSSSLLFISGRFFFSSFCVCVCMCVVALPLWGFSHTLPQFVAVAVVVVISQLSALNA